MGLFLIFYIGSAKKFIRVFPIRCYKNPNELFGQPILDYSLINLKSLTPKFDICPLTYMQKEHHALYNISYFTNNLQFQLHIILYFCYLSNKNQHIIYYLVFHYLKN